MNPLGTRMINLLSRCAPLLGLILGLAIAGCGSHKASTPPSPDPTTATATQLPAVMTLDALPPSNVKRASDTPTNVVEFEGGDYIATSPGTTRLLGGPVRAQLQPELPAAWVVYALDGLNPGGPTVAGWYFHTGEEFPDGYFVAAANFATGRWEVRPALVDLRYQLQSNREDYISPAGRFYVAYLAYSRHQLVVTGSFTLDDGSPLSTVHAGVGSFPGGINYRVQDADLRTETYEVTINGPGYSYVQSHPFLPRDAFNVTGLPEGDYTVSIRALAGTEESPVATYPRQVEARWLHFAGFAVDSHVPQEGEITSLSLLPDGSILGAGTLWQWWSEDGTSHDRHSGLLLHYAPDGALLGQQLLSELEIHDLDTSQGQIFIVGRLRIDEASPESGLIRNTVLAKLNPDLSVAWAVSWPITSYAGQRVRLAVTGSQVIVAEEFEGGNGSTTALRRLALNGGMQTHEEHVGWDRLLLRDLAVDPSGNSFLIGESTDSQANYQTQFILDKFDSEGQLVWQKRWKGAVGDLLSDTVLSLCPDPSGGIYIGTGTRWTSYSTMCTGHVFRIDAGGGLVWHRALPGFGRSAFRGITLDESGQLWTLGSTWDGTGQAAEIATRWDADGLLLETQSLAGWADTFAVQGNNIYLGGAYYGWGWDGTLSVPCGAADGVGDWLDAVGEWSDRPVKSLLYRLQAADAVLVQEPPRNPEETLDSFGFVASLPLD